MKFSLSQGGEALESKRAEITASLENELKNFLTRVAILEAATLRRAARLAKRRAGASEAIGRQLAALRPTVDETLTSIRAPRRWRALRDYISGRMTPAAASAPIHLLQFLERCARHRDSTVRRANLRALCAALDLKSLTTDEGPPEVSILVLATRRTESTFATLASIALSSRARRHEILLGVDTLSASAFEGALGPMVHLIHTDANAGQAQALATLAAQARGECIVVLRSGALALSGCIDAIVDTFAARDNVGVVATKITRDDGRLLQAGENIMDDGRVVAIGEGERPAHPRYNYVRGVDSASDLSFAMSKAVWTRLGWPRPDDRAHHLTATDISMGARSMGLQTIYQPSAEVVALAGIDPEPKSLAPANLVQPLEIGGEEAMTRMRLANAREPARRKPAILFIDHYVPQWDRDAGSRTIYQYIRMFLDSGFHVGFWPAGMMEDREYVRPLQQLGVEVFYDKRLTGGFAAWWRAVAADYKYAFACRPDVTWKFIDELKAARVKVAYYGVDLHFQRLRRQSEVEGSRRLKGAARRIRAIELAICARSDLILYPSEEELDIVRAAVGASIPALAIPIILFTPAEIATSKQNLARIEANNPHALMFVGGFSHTPNVDGVVWFVTNVMPILREHDSRFRLTIAGSNPTQAILDLANADIEIVGRVSDEQLRALYADAGMSIAPLRYGSGVKGKVIEALGNGTPLVTTTIGAQGVPRAADIMGVADDAPGFAAAIIDIATDRAMARQRASAALKFIEESYTVDGLKLRLKPFFNELS